MNSQEILIELSKYKNKEGNHFFYKGSKIKITKIIAAPYNLNEFMKIKTEYIDNCENTVKLCLSDNYDLYFFENPYKLITSFIRLNDFLKDCIEE
ncbi:MAG TPA: hypothetical protein DDX39_00145 [Bacteroidales bacterium]|nr:MAG: hypothetical protein A2W98_03410 [Bacteroidetes bacterium GWF2_33_38]OFY72175.1 MAG: hypothetical protein A2265_08695 [Bacteroidetes bacterium RIFOXYA12_FULL_33_9]OFY85792.1 MAG: hypothetical protein A2236_05985 [Bacteroidetes bacterium RIFOXYA2_FULL_33_7]HBF87019.1 hypothetical protein [Bacteroidales bacterium]